MTTSGESRTSDLVEALDGGAGPALLQSEDRQRAIARSIVARAAATRARGRVSGQRGLQVAAAVLLALALAGSAWAAVAAYRHADRQAEAARDARLPADQHNARSAPPRPVPKAPPLQPVQPAVAATPPAADVPAIVHARAVATGRDLLEHANRLRAARRWRAADRMYSRVAAEHRGSDEAYAALISAATLRLAHTGRPGDALEMYQHALALRPHGSLVEQARYGIAEAHRALVQPRLEAQALRTFLAAHAHSVRASAARARLAELKRSSGL